MSSNKSYISIKMERIDQLAIKAKDKIQIHQHLVENELEDGPAMTIVAQEDVETF